MKGQKYFDTPPLAVTDYKADANHFTPGRILPARVICLHDTVGTNSLDWLARTPGSNASAHRLISRSGHIYKLVGDQDTAWTNGPSQLYTLPGSRANQLSIYLTIEMEHKHDADPTWPDAQVAAAAAQCVEWYGYFGILPIVSHWQVQGNKVDPQGFPWESFWHFMVSRLKQCLSVH